METINNLATAAAKVVWGENEANKEPISGKLGDVSRGQPYDAGNLDASEYQRSHDSLDAAPNTEPAATGAPSTSTDTPASTDTSTPASTSNPAIPSIPSTAVGEAGSVSKPSVTDASGAQPSLSDTTAAQNDTRDPDDESAQVELTGPGPRPLNIVAKEHGGDAGNDREDGAKAAASSSSSSESEAKASTEAAEDSENLGSGQMYVKTSGLAADGGDFDATKPGAGKEADRLLEEKGIHPAGSGSGPGSGIGTESGSGSGSHHGHTKDKPSLGERIKAKLHKH